MAITSIPNETGNIAAYFATETIPGVAVTPTQRLFGTFESNKNRPLRQREEATGGYDRYTTPSRERPTYSGTYREDATYETLPALLQYAITGAPVTTSDAQTVPGFTHLFEPTFNADDLDSMTVRYGIDGRGFQSTGVCFNDFNISADHTNADNIWDFSGGLFLRDKVRVPGWFDGIATGGTNNTIVMTGAGYGANAHVGKFVTLGRGNGEVRRILSHTADTLTLEAPVLSAPVTSGTRFHIAGNLPVIGGDAAETIEAEGTEVFVDLYNAATSTLGTTDVSDRVASWNVTQELNISSKHRASGQIARRSRGARWVTGTIRFEADRWDEYRAWEEDDRISIRIQKRGSVINPSPATYKLARIDVEKAIWDVPTDDAVDNNMTLSLSFRALLNPGDPVFSVLAKNAMAALP
jgi:hypothetical protein